MRLSALGLIGLCLLFNGSIQGQSTEDVGKIALSVVMPESLDGLDASQLSKIQSKIMNIATGAGFAAAGFDHNFVIYPTFAIYDSEVSQGGMQNITVVTTELSLFIKQMENKIVFSSVSKTIKGSGKNKQAAVTNAISKIPVSDPQIKTFIETGKTQILKYYELKCNDIILKAESLVKQQEFEQALGLLMTIPDAVSCYPRVLDKAAEVYRTYQNQRCREDIQSAKAALEANEYALSLSILSRIDPSSVCAAESLSLMKTAGTKVDANEKRNWDFAMRAYSDSVALEKLRINAIKEVAVAYYSSRPREVNYMYIIR